MSEIRSLAEIISSQVEVLLRLSNNDFPSLDEPFDPEADRIRQDEKVAHATNLIVAAAGQLVATVRSPATSVLTGSLAWALPACLKVANEFHVAEILREAGSQGLHVDLIASKANAEPRKLNRILRYLATNHIFREVKPDVYCNNKLSSTLDTTKAPDDIIKDSSNKHDGTNGVSALVGFLAGRDFMAAGHMHEHLADPVASRSEEPDVTVFKRSCGKTLFEWLAEPENAQEKKNFGIGMAGANAIQLPVNILSGFDWESLPQGSLVVDIGGGVGSVVLEVAKRYPHLKYIVQDLPHVAEAGEKWFNDRLPAAIQSGMVRFEGHDFFEPQPVRDLPPAVFIFRMIAHNWSDKYLSRILQNLRQAASPSTALVLVDSILLNACPDTSAQADIKGASVPPPPGPLLANLGQAKEIAYSTDILMLNNLNAQERTLREFKAVLAESSWRIDRIHRADPYGVPFPITTALPI